MPRPTMRIRAKSPRGAFCDRLAAHRRAADHSKGYEVGARVSTDETSGAPLLVSFAGGNSRRGSVAMRPLPAQPLPLIGRERDLAQARERVLLPVVRLLTLTGPGGSGKTRLALELASELRDTFSHGVAFVDLTSIRDPSLVLPAIADALGIREEGGLLGRERLVSNLRELELLLLLDNCEQVVDSAPVIGELLASCPHLKVLATSRERLHLRWEHEFSVPPLGVPDLTALPPVDNLARSPAVALFIERAQSVEPTFALSEGNAHAVAEVCVRLDGLPLALELAARHVRILAPEALLRRLQLGVGLLLRARTPDLPARHQALHATFAWSYGLLTAQERALFRRLAVFSGGCTLAAAEAVCAGGELQTARVLETLEVLLDKSLVYRRTAQDNSAIAAAPEPRFDMLQTVREYGLEQLEATGEAHDLRRRHAEYFLALAEQAEPQLKGPRQAIWFAQLDAELDNLRAALQSSSNSDNGSIGLRFGWALARFWHIRGYLGEGRRWLAAALAKAPAGTPQRARALWSAGDLAFLQGDYPVAHVLLQQALAVAQEVGDTLAAALAKVQLGAAALLEGDCALASALLENNPAESSAVGSDNDLYLLHARSLYWRSELAQRQGEDERAQRLYEAALRLMRDHGDTRRSAYPMVGLGLLALTRGDHDRATHCLRESLALGQQFDDRYGVLMSLKGLGQVAAAQGGHQRAVRLFGAADALQSLIGGSHPHQRHSDRYARAIAELRSALGEVAFETAWSAGRALPLEQAIHEALAGRRVVEDAAAGTLEADDGGLLTAREQQISALIARGLTSREIAAELVISERTADTHADRIRTKLGLRSRAEIAAWAARRGAD
jgi:predicted ATPase/DNA-binding CsgD family transcriptional regulator